MSKVMGAVVHSLLRRTMTLVGDCLKGEESQGTERHPLVKSDSAQLKCSGLGRALFVHSSMFFVATKWPKRDSQNGRNARRATYGLR